MTTSNYLLLGNTALLLFILGLLSTQIQNINKRIDKLFDALLEHIKDDLKCK